MRIGAKLPSSGPLPGRVGIPAMAQRIEAAGFASMWVSDHVLMPERIDSHYPFAADGVARWGLDDPWYDAIVAMSMAVAVTTHVEIGVAVLVLPLRHPVILAKEVASLDALSGGRIALGVGAGWLAEEFEALNVPYDSRGARMDEWVALLRACWTGRPAAIDGAHYRLPAGTRLYPTPAHEIPLLFGGVSNVALRQHPPIDYQDLHYYAAPKKKPGPKSLDEVDPELLRTYERLGIPLRERAILAGVEGAEDERPPIAIDAVFDSVSVATTFRATLAKSGVIFCPISEAVRDHPELVRKYLGTVVPAGDNYFAALNSAVFTDGSFVYIPKGVRCPMELSTYFRINARNTGQFERTLIIAEAGAYVSYLEGCTAPQRDENQLHAAVVELVVFDDAQIKYSTVQNWYPGDANGVGGIYNFVTKRGACRGARSKISWTQVETGSAITWKYPSCILLGDDSVGEFYSVAVTTNHQQADTGTKMIHIGRNTKSTIVSKGISAGKSNNTYRGLVRVMPKAHGARNHTQCDSLLIGDQCGAHTVPYIESRNPTAKLEHEATTSKIADDQLFYCRQRGLSQEDAVGLIVNGFCKDVLKELPMEFAVEAQKLLAISLEGSVG